MRTYVIAVAVIFAVFAGWVGVQHVARAFALRHPEFGPPREEGEGCGKSCGCSVADRLECEDRRRREDEQHAVL